MQQRMWSAPRAQPQELPAAVARRELVQGMYLQEDMRPAEERANEATRFTRTAMLNFNQVGKQGRKLAQT